MRPIKPTIGWREWISLPDLGVPGIKAKVDTGARSSSLHAFDILVVRGRGRSMVSFQISSPPGDPRPSIACEAPLHDERQVRSSDGRQELRPVIRTRIAALGDSWDIDLTLTSRGEMGFEMLLGREAVRRRFVVDPGRSFLLKKLAKRRPKED